MTCPPAQTIQGVQDIIYTVINSPHFSHPLYCIGAMIRPDCATRKRVPPRVAQRTQAGPSAAS